MRSLDQALADSRDAVEHLIASSEQRAAEWAAPRGPGKWSPSQLVEHVARSLEESAHMAAGQPSKFPNLPAILHPVLRAVLFKRVLRNGAFPKAKTNPAMNPASGPASPAEGRARLETAHQTFAAAARQSMAHAGRLRTTMFGAVAVEEYVRFMELHTRHHAKQLSLR
jgi:Protein of unknown function (DUF1569)